MFYANYLIRLVGEAVLPRSEGQSSHWVTIYVYVCDGPTGLAADNKDTVNWVSNGVIDGF